MKRFQFIAAALYVVMLMVIGSAHGRGIGGGGFGGGVHSGGAGGGGFHGAAGLGGGGLGGGGLGTGGFGGGDRAGGFGGAGLGGGGFGGDRGAFQGGLGGVALGGAGFGGDRSGFQGGLADRFGGAGSGFDGNRFGGQGFGGAAFRGGAGFGGFDRGQFGGLGGAPPTRSQLGSFLGLPTDGGLSAASGHDFGARYSGSASGLSAAAAGERGASGGIYHGPDGTTIAHGSAGERGAVVGPRGAAAGERGVSGTVVKGPQGNVYAHGEAGARGFYDGARGAGTWHWSAADGRVQGNYVRANYRDYGAFNRDWYRRYPGAWWARGFAAGVWTAATWPVINTWFGVDWPALAYSYGDDITYVDNNVCLYGQPIATTADYYQSAADLAQTGEQADVPSEQPPADADPFAPAQDDADQSDAQWLPLGVFEAIPPGEKSSDMTFQLAVNKQGIIRGNYFDSSDKNVQQAQGAVDKQTQRVTWVVGDRKNIIFDTGLYNLTKDESMMLVHEGPDKTQQWTLVRLKQPAQANAQE